MTRHEEKVRQLKERMLEVAYKNQRGFLASSFSILDILVVLYYEVMQADGHGTCVDEFVLSKGHAALALYAILEDKHVLKNGELEHWGKYQSQLCLMAERKLPGVLFSTGSLGHGLPEAVGLAYAKKLRKEDGRVFVLVGDGELDEGTNWEAILAASRMKLDNLVCIVDNNKSAASALVEKPEEAQRFERFGLLTECVNGHDEHALRKALQKKADRVMLVIADTIKGNGCAAMEANPALWHSKAPNEQEYISMLEEVRR
ncbi:MAG: transketolase [Lachnospiraceae bacterium]|nr:transketolase [Lachnospiraceae bacterium]